MSDYYKLLPCPFFGGEAAVMLEQDASGNTSYCCFCLECDAETYGDKSDFWKLRTAYIVCFC